MIALKAISDVCAIAVIACAGVIMIRVPAGNFDTIRAKRLEIVNDSGAVMAVVETDRQLKAGTIHLFSPNNPIPTFVVGFDGIGNRLVIRSPGGGGGNISLSATYDGGQVAVDGAVKTNTVVIQSSNDLNGSVVAATSTAGTMSIESVDGKLFILGEYNGSGGDHQLTSIMGTRIGFRPGFSIEGLASTPASMKSESAPTAPR